MKSEKNILITAFDPFGDDKINSALETLEHLPDEVDGDRIIKLQLPTVFGKSSQVVKEAIQKRNRCGRLARHGWWENRDHP